ncbi:DUF5807 family protein [Haloplanus sp. GCM10025708]|uniref:DUF5807 family protein n=1 Tax=Haloferacaceae TaxID=1644056 RepID=UPI0036077CE9
MSNLDEFLAGERLDHVALYLTHEYLDSEGKIANYGEAVDGGVVLVVPGDEGRRLFTAGTGMDAMNFARKAMGTDGHIDRDLTGGDCPGDGEVKFVFAFAEEQNEEVGGIYADGDVIHAYAYCDDGTAFSDRWVVE